MNTRIPSKKAATFAAAALFAFAPVLAHAESISSAGDNTWETGAAWNGGNVPAADDDAVIQNHITLTADETIHNLSIDSGELDLGTHTLTVTGNFSNDGTFTPGTGTINLAGGEQRLTGETTFYNLTKTVSSAAALWFPIDDTTTVTGRLTLSGTSGNLLEVRGYAPGELDNPKAAAVDSNGRIWITDDFNSRIVVLNEDGTTYATYDGSDISSLAGSPDAGFGEPGPNGIAIDANGKVYIMDVGNQRIVVLNPDGTAADVITGDDISSLPGSPDAGFHDAKGISIAPNGDIYVGDGWDGNGVIVLNPDGTAKAVYDGSDISSLAGSPDAGFNNPVTAVVNSEGDIFVADAWNDRIVKLNPDGTAADVITGDDISSLPGSPTNGFDDLQQIVIDADDNIYAADDSNGRIVKLNPDGTAAAVFTGDGISSLAGAPDNLFGNWDTVDGPGPSGLTYKDGKIYVADVGRGRIVVIDTDGTPEAVYDASASTALENEWHLDAEGSTDASRLSVKSSNNEGTEITCANCTNAGGNTGWKFVSTGSAHHSSGGSGNACAAGFAWNTGTESCVPKTAAVPAAGATTATTSAPYFVKTLDPGVTDPEVLLLQQFLNARGFTLAATGAGAPGSETSFYGSLTEAALKKFQEANPNDILAPLHLTQGTGIFGSYTRAFANALVASGK